MGRTRYTNLRVPEGHIHITYDHTYPPRSSWHHLDSMSCLSKSCLSSPHIFKLQLYYLSKLCCISIIGFVLDYCGVDLIHTIARFPYSIYPIEPLDYIFKYHSIIFNLMLTHSCSPVLHYSICKWVNWVMQCFTNPCPMSKCNIYYLWVIVVTLI
jgi:hypothetical protein